MCLTPPSAPPPPSRTPEAPTPPAVSGVGAAEADKRRRAQAMGQGASTILTGARGVTSTGATQQKTLLGQ